MHRAIRRSAPQMSARGRRAWRSPSGPRRSAPRFAWLETPRAAVAVLGYATPPRGFVASLRTRRGAVHPIRATGQRVTDDQRACLAEERLNFGAGGQPLTARKSAGYTVSRLRPFARRRLSTFRPPFVFMRSRKPCVLARRRRFG